MANGARQERRKVGNITAGARRDPLSNSRHAASPMLARSTMLRCGAKRTPVTTSDYRESRLLRSSPSTPCVCAEIVKGKRPPRSGTMIGRNPNCPPLSVEKHATLPSAPRARHARARKRKAMRRGKQDPLIPQRPQKPSTIIAAWQIVPAGLPGRMTLEGQGAPRTSARLIDRQSCVADAVRPRCGATATKKLQTVSIEGRQREEELST